MSRTALLPIIALSLATGGCWFKKKPPPAPPPPPAPAPTATQPTPTSPPTVQPPKREAPPPKPKPAAAEPATPLPSPVPQVPAPAPQAPVLGPMLTTEQRAQYRQQYDGSLKVAQDALARIAGKPLTRDQAESANRIRSFISQARDAQARDPITAAQLARRAEILARDLLNSIH